MSTNIIVKVKYADDIRKAALPISEVNTFTAMANWIAETYNLDGSNNLMLKYKDEDGDMITMINDDDLHLALTSQQKLYIHAFVCEESSAASNNGSRRASPTKTESVACCGFSTT
uniref:PB1 domain-containing protein n=1 Tax=Panagrolaimus davidi TaxID=227884 RepID=A0A914PT80_9BILA